MSGLNLGEIQTVLAEVLCGFPQSLQASASIVHQSHHDCFPPSLSNLLFATHLTIWFCAIWDPDSTVKKPPPDNLPICTVMVLHNYYLVVCVLKNLQSWSLKQWNLLICSALSRVLDEHQLWPPWEPICFFTRYSVSSERKCELQGTYMKAYPKVPNSLFGARTESRTAFCH